jgi:hypothetical protein
MELLNHDISCIIVVHLLLVMRRCPPTLASASKAQPSLRDLDVISMIQEDLHSLNIKLTDNMLSNISM